MTAPTTLVQLADVKAHLNITSNDDDTELQNFINAATEKIQEITGPVLSRTVTEYRNGGEENIVLWQRPVQSITSVTELLGSIPYTLTEIQFGAGTNNYHFTFDVTESEIQRRVVNWPAPFIDGDNNIKIVYVAGYATIPSAIRLATLALIQHWWSASQLNRQGGRPALGGNDYAPAIGGGYAIPNFVREMLPQVDKVSWTA